MPIYLELALVRVSCLLTHTVRVAAHAMAGLNTVGAVHVVWTLIVLVSSERPRNCHHAFQLGQSANGLYEIDPQDGKGSFNVWCDMTNASGWTVIQRRRDGSENFNRDWEDYRVGFGDLTGEFWLGLDKIHRLATNQVIWVDLMNSNNDRKYAQYDWFSVGPRSSGYWMTVGKYSGDAGDALSWSSGHKFTAKDKDNDSWAKNCAEAYKGAWWYGDGCHYHVKDTQSWSPNGMNWSTWKQKTSLKFIEIKIRPWH